MMHSCLLFFQDVMLKNVVVCRKPMCKTVWFFFFFCVISVARHWETENEKFHEDRATRFTAFPVLSLSLQSVKHNTSVLLKYEFYIKVD